ncbi:MAG: nucleoside deaminase [Muribaculaceae bacterium]|nr:nucleoside deaminase [Muribaculaceae bacterium]
MLDTNPDVYFMGQALIEARKAMDEDEIPIGAVVVAGGRIIGRGHNMTERLNDVTAHAEMIALTAAANSTDGKYLTDATLYVTVEPCLMCAGAIGWSQIRRIVYGAGDSKRGYTTFTNRTPFHPKATVTPGVLAEEAAALMRTFFASKRR